MNQIPDLQIESVAPVSAREMALTPTSPRLVVVIREAEEEAVLAGRIQELARQRCLSVLLVGIARDAASEAALRRSLVTIAAFLKANSHASAPEIRIEQGRDWISKVRAVLTPGDTLACYSEQKAGILERPLSDTLATGLNMPVYTFAGLRGDGIRRQTMLAQIVSWAGSLASIGAFVLLQARIVMAVQGWLQSVLLLGTLLAEVGVVWLVNSLIAQV